LKNFACIKLTLKRLDEKISSVSSSQPDDIDDDGIEDIFKDFPLSEEINLINLEEKLKKDMIYKRKLVNILITLINVCVGQVRYIYIFLQNCYFVLVQCCL